MRKALTVFSGIVLAVGCAGPASDPLPEPAPEPPAEEVYSGYHVDEYLEATSALQALGKEEACKRLRLLAEHEQRREARKVFVICRMLFTSKPGGEFRSPALGAPSFMGDTSKKDWPLVPIEIVDGIPFYVVTGYILAGVSEHPLEYVEYCIGECSWSPVTFGPKSQEEKQAALGKLLASPKWRRQLEQYEIEFFAAQVRERKKQ